MRPRLLVIAKSPALGRSKTRLCPPLRPKQAALVAEAALADTLEVVSSAAAGGPRPVLALDGEPGAWLPPGFDVVAQRGDGLAERLAAAFADVGEPAVLIGMDTPQVTATLLRRATELLSSPAVDAVFGPAADGGWWALGLRRPDARVFAGVPMSSADTGALQRARLDRLGLRTAELPILRDVDLMSDAIEVAEGAPEGRFAAAVRACLVSAETVGVAR